MFSQCLVYYVHFFISVRVKNKLKMVSVIHINETNKVILKGKDKTKQNAPSLSLITV